MEPEQIRDALLAWLARHRDECHDLDCGEPANVLAWLAHCAGLRRDRLSDFATALEEYERRCEGCQHLRN